MTQRDEREAAPAGAAEPDIGPVRADRAADARRGALSALDPIAAYERRTTRIREEIARNRRGEYTVPTWVLAVALAAVVGLWILVLFVF